MKEKPDKNKISVTARIGAETHEKLLLAIELSGWDQSDIMRHALDLGLDELKHIGYKINDALRDAIKSAKESKQAAPSKIETHPVEPLKSIKPNPKRQKTRLG